jgi:hypothetical protein
LYSPKTWLESFFSISSSHCCTTDALMPESSMAAALRSRASTRPDETGRPAVGGGAGPRRGDPETPPSGTDADVASDVEAAAGVADVAGETSMLTSAAAAPAGTGRAVLGGKLSEGRRSLLGGTGTAGSDGAGPTTDGRRSSAMRGCSCGSGFRTGVLGDDVGDPANVCDHCFDTPAAGDDEPVPADADTDDDNADEDDDDDDDDEDVEVAGVAAAKEGDEKKAPNLALSEEGAGAAVVVAALGAGSFSHERR